MQQRSRVPDPNTTHKPGRHPSVDILSIPVAGAVPAAAIVRAPALEQPTAVLPIGTSLWMRAFGQMVKCPGTQIPDLPKPLLQENDLPDIAAADQMPPRQVYGTGEHAVEIEALSERIQAAVHAGTEFADPGDLWSAFNELGAELAERRNAAIGRDVDRMDTMMADFAARWPSLGRHRAAEAATPGMEMAA